HSPGTPGIFWIQERFYESGNRANIWLVRGSQRDVVIDAGLGLRSLPEYLRDAGLLAPAEGAGPRPLLAVATHGNIRVSKMLTKTRDTSMSSVAGTIRRHSHLNWQKKLPNVLFVPFKKRDKHIQFPVTNLFAGDVINLGDRQLAVMHMPGHSRGSICLHDKDRKILFSGDVVYDGSMIDWLPYSRISDYVASCQRLIELVDRGLVEKVLPGHFNIFGAERLYWLASNYISQAGICHKISACAMRSIASVALHVANSRITS
ncbi:MBLC2 protein, partial [Polioptila caerulea]|nr:MBLC2 protein [Polioptila caerulea]